MQTAKEVSECVCAWEGGPLFSVFLQPLCCTLNVQIIKDFCEKNKDKFRVSASLLILFTPSLIGPVIQQLPAVGAHYISVM